ncbi:MAG: hypothetical protein HYZ14_02930 [Bacteroidetes bacterium]|nr:hypothetical protein [Bacteroidota bacterium]
MKPLQSAAFYFALFFCCGFLLFFPVPYYLFPDIGKMTEPLLQPLIQTVGINWFGLDPHFTSQLLSDSPGLYVFVFLLTLFSTVCSLFFTILSKAPVNPKLKLWFFTLMSYYLALILLKYGADKIFKHQFYLPEPNTLYTPVGQLTPDILFWSSMGTSYSYTVFSGLIEIIPALLLLFRKTRLAGTLIATGVLLNVVMLNFGFDITVKVYSLFLLFTALVLLAPHLPSLYRFFVIGRETVKIQPEPLIASKRSLLVYTLLKTLAFGLLVYESFGIYFEQNNLNDDTAQRPPLHGAYDVTSFTDNGTLVPASMSCPDRFKRIFFHRRSYFIIQTMDDRFIDFKLYLDTANHKLRLEDERIPESNRAFASLNYSTTGNELIIYGYLFDSNISLSATKTDLYSLPLLREPIHWTIDGFKHSSPQ